MNEHSVLFVADSRGRELNTQLAKYFSRDRYFLYWRKGLRFNQTADQIIPLIKARRPSLVYILNGICDVTYIKSYNPWSVDLREHTPDAALASYMTEVDSLHAQIYQMSDLLGYKLMVIFAPLIGVDLATYNQDPTLLHSSQQSLLNDAIYLINKHIHTLNTAMGIVTPPCPLPLMSGAGENIGPIPECYAMDATQHSNSLITGQPSFGIMSRKIWIIMIDSR